MITWPNTRLCDLLDIEHPIIQAPMAGASTPEMAAVVANTGGLGSLGCALMSDDVLTDVITKTRQLTNRAINLNFFCHKPPVHDEQRAKAAQTRLQPWYDEFGLSDMPDAIETHFPFDENTCDIVLKAAPKVISFHFGLPDPKYVLMLKQAGIVVLSSATSRAEAVWLNENGADAIIAQGYEAGGHNGWFLPQTGDVAGTMALVPRIVDAVDCPVIAAGGIADGRGIAAAFALGASGVQIGTAFLATPESSASDVHKRALMDESGDNTQYSQAFSGRAARTIVNRYAKDMDAVTDWPDFPLMNTLSGPLRGSSAKAGRADAIALWAGQGAGLVTSEDTKQVFDRLVTDAKERIRK